MRGFSQEPRPATFAELDVQETVTAPELLETLEDYATGGWAINGPVTLRIAQRTAMTQDQFQALYTHALAGVEAQEQRLQHGAQRETTTHREQEQYLLVARYAAWNLIDTEAR